MGQNRLNNLTLINIECDLLREINLTSVISKFAHIQSIKVCLLKLCVYFISSIKPRAS